MLDAFIASATGSFLAEVITLPICTIKTIYQNEPKLTMKGSIQQIYQMNGMKGFYQAMVPAVLSQVASTSIKFAFYEKMKEIRNTQKDDILNNALNGMISGIFGSIFTHPIDVWKNYQQRNVSYLNEWKKMKFTQIPKDLLYIGYKGSFGKNIALYSTLFPIYDFYSKFFQNTTYASICTTITVSFIIQPFDYYKTVKMAKNQTTNYTRGLSLMIMRSIPHFWITMTITEFIKKELNIKK